MDQDDYNTLIENKDWLDASYLLNGTDSFDYGNGYVRDMPLHALIKTGCRNILAEIFSAVAVDADDLHKKGPDGLDAFACAGLIEDEQDREEILDLLKETDESTE
tara:strand:- start:1973 stop:2287 length:315 start_codon:yes stop_codon:yes gene_type:complete